jgi:pilus assembly protein Flp/PilA
MNFSLRKQVMIKKLLKSFWHNNAGATAMEYGLIAVLIGLAALVSITGTGKSNSKTYETVADCMNDGGATSGACFLNTGT